MTGVSARRILFVLLLPLRLVFSVWAFLFVLASWLGLAVAVSFMTSGRPGARRARRLSGYWARFATTVWGILTLVRGRENLAGLGNVMLVSNHTGWADTTILMAVFKADFLFLAKKEIERWPTIGSAMLKGGHLFVDRTAATRARVIGDMAEALRTCCSVSVFPEGGFVRAEGLRHFAIGGFKAAAEAGVPVVPVAMRGSRRLLRAGLWLPRPGIVRITIGPPILPRADTREEAERLRDEARAFILANCGEPDATKGALSGGGGA